jgi:hypothetical protein
VAGASFGGKERLEHPMHDIRRHSDAIIRKGEAQAATPFSASFPDPSTPDLKTPAAWHGIEGVP